MKKNLKLVVSILSMLTLVGCTGNSSSGSNSSNSNNSINSNESDTTTSSVEETTYPLTLTTYNSASEAITQTYNQVPEKIVTGNLSSTEMLCAFGLSSKIKGMLTPDNAVTGTYKEQIDGIKKLGNKKTISKEVILNEEPDFIFSRAASFSTNTETGKGALGTPNELNTLDINMYSQKASISDKNINLDYIIDDVKNIGKIFNLNAKANEIAASLKTKEETITTKVANKNTSNELKNALIMTGYSKSTAGGETYGVFRSALQEKMLNMLGYTNHIDTTISGTNYTSENLVASNPELIILVTSDRNAKADATAIDLMKTNTIISEVPAIKNDKIIKINYDDFMDYGMRVFDALETLYNFIYGE